MPLGAELLWLSEPSAIEAMLASLPRARRVELQWAVQRVQTAFAAIASAPTDRALLARQTATFVVTMRAFSAQIAPLVSDPAPTTAVFDSAIGEAERVIARRDAAAAAAVRWVYENVLVRLAGWTAGRVASVDPDAVLAGPSDAQLEEIASSPHGALWRVNVLLGAMLHATRHAAAPETLVELAWATFDEGTRAADLAARFVPALNAPPVSAESAERVIEAAARVRAALRPADAKILEGAAVRGLR